ncbi:CopG family transcriptional regulator [Mycolicibacter sp. MYC123]|uniref:CopG family transcriptional regulator n=1 Tax=[Mycobacterium] zoologicum TaxID=2872311 RepID=A0ABU5YG36_9MYCO|nr:CopG family transcriptional regulator [Mycolicibacter sp. MYC123]MEB3048806.1 CopG family transcriptional regulator [Mycolicibacter sp. MYC123]
MNKTTVYLPDELEARLDAHSVAVGVSKAELIRRGIAMVLDTAPVSKRSPLPVFRSGRVRDAQDMDDGVYAHIKERAARR